MGGCVGVCQASRVSQGPGHSACSSIRHAGAAYPWGLVVVTASHPPGGGHWVRL